MNDDYTDEERIYLAELKKLPPLDRVARFIKERESVRLKRENGLPPPWTEHPIIRRFRLTNCRRMDDRVSLWIMKNWYTPNRGHPLMIPAIALARFINLPSSLKAIGFPKRWEPNLIKRMLRQIASDGKAIFNGAYVVRGNSGKDKVASVVDYYVGPLVENPPEIDTDSMENTWASLSGYFGFGSFMAGQCVADARWAIEGRWLDKDEWAPIGPGSRKGMNRILERPENQGMKPEEFVEHLLWFMDEEKKRLPKAIWDRLEAHDWQNICCETHKVERCLWGLGQPKQRYPGQPDPELSEVSYD